jgi:TonB family protein
MGAPERKFADWWNTLWWAIVSLALGLWICIDIPWDPETDYYIPSKLWDGGETKTGRTLINQRRGLGAVFLAASLYCFWCVVRNRAPYFSSVDFKPVPIDQRKPILPEGTQRLGKRANVTIEFTVNTNGAVENPTVYYASDPECGESALAAVQTWKFEPALKKGRPVQCRMRVPIEFDGSAFH